MRKLQDILADIPIEALPVAWLTIDRGFYSQTKRLWDYQQKALENALKALWKYYGDLSDYCSGEALSINAERKARLFQWYRDNGLIDGLQDDLAIPLDTARRDIRRLLEAYYPADNGRVPYEQFINRIGFWMATGSGKTLVLIKLVELLWWLMRLGEIPPNDVVVLTCRDDLLTQLKTHVAEFNAANPDLYIRLCELKEYPTIKRSTLSLFGDQEITVFYYRSDNLSDVQKERIVDFRNYDNAGQWYVLLDEAHKGDREDSKRQHIYSILCRNGFLFNFSATFTDRRDILTTAYDFNLARFVEAGYGKHISILAQENRAFRDDEDYTGEEKQKVVLKSMLMLAHARLAEQTICRTDENGHLYHRPLLLTLVNSVNTDDSDLKLFFRELERIGQREFSDTAWQQAKEELRQELAQGPDLLFEAQRFQFRPALFDSITPQTLLETVYNAPGPGDTEVWVRPSNRQELAFKLKSAERPFALIKIGDITGWLKAELSGYVVIEGYADEGFFERLNADDSAINILMGSRSFYEGWDSNRPNVITFINIGLGTDARKFILQSVGRGVRIEPFPGQRKRLQALYNAGEVAPDRYRSLRQDSLPLETLFIFGTNRQALQTVIAQLDQEEGEEVGHELALEVNQPALDNHALLIPVYRQSSHPLLAERSPRKFEITAEELSLLADYWRHLDDERLLFARHRVSPRHIGMLRRCLERPADYFNTSNGRRYGNLDLLLRRICGYFDVIPQRFDHLKPLEDEIRHFRHIRVSLEDIGELKDKIDQVKGYPRRAQREAQLRERFEARKISFDEMLYEAGSLDHLSSASRDRYDGSNLEVRYVANHYYFPVILSYDEKVEYIRHVIHHPSEIRFLDALESYLRKTENRFAELDWWLFSRLDETLDQVFIPYYDPNTNTIRRFHPDFIFWLQRGEEYFILFVDPKGMQQVGYQHKIDGYRQIFEESSGGLREFVHNGLRVRVGLSLYTDDANRAPHEYRRYWYDRPAALLEWLA